MNYHEFPLKNPSHWRAMLPSKASLFDHFVFLDSSDLPDEKGRYRWLCGGGTMFEVQPQPPAFNSLRTARKEHRGWWFGRLNYDLKNEVEHLYSKNQSRFDWSDSRFFEAEWVVACERDRCRLLIHPNSTLTEESWRAMFNRQVSSYFTHPLELRAQMSKSEYLSRARQLQDHIQRGDIYEVNFCQEFYSKEVSINPTSTFHHLKKVTSPPMSALMRMENEWVLSMSPERYLSKQGNRLISQPIKGTARRSPNPEEDHEIAERLHMDPKERSENVMIVDLVRNDLSKVASRKSIEVSELFGVYSFQTVHQMISTVEGILHPERDIWDALAATFPMGSMTGAPKVSAMKWIENFELHKREIYSGAIGYISPEDDFDFNVVIRSVIYDDRLKELSVSVGSALTIKADLENEWEECLLKLRAIKDALASPLVGAV